MLSVLALLAAASAVSARTITVLNSCDYTIWPAVAGTNSNSGYDDARGWEAAPGYSKTVTIPDVWNGRVWPRRGCSFDADGAGSCVAGNCPAGLNCEDNTMGWANLLEVNLGADGMDWYDISAVPGFVAPMAVSSSDPSCTSVTCGTDLNPSCPDDRMKLTDSSGIVVGCLSACMAGIDAGDDSVNCCSGTHGTTDTCSADEVDYYSFFKNGCEHAYAYPFDDQSSLPTVVYTCSSANLPSYTVEFCPSALAEASSRNLDADASNVSGRFARRRRAF